MTAKGRMFQANAQPEVPAAGIKRDVDTVSLTSEDFNDRIINLRFIHDPIKPGDPPKTFTIRSDYEILYSGGTYQYIDCRQKPSIKVTYKQVANSTAIELNIDVANLFIKDMTSMERNAGMIRRVEIQMGYKSQMSDWARDPWYSERPASDFLALLDNSLETSSSWKVPAERIVADVLTTQRISGPPDMVTRFQCVVGNISQGLVWKADADTIRKMNYGYHTSSSWGAKKPFNNLPLTFFALITMRFINPRFHHTVDERQTVVSAADGKLQVVTTRDDVYVYSADMRSVTRVPLKDGRLSNEPGTGKDGKSAADYYGITVFMSDVLWQTPLEELPLFDLTEDQVLQTAPIMHPPFVEMYDSVSAQLNSISKQYPFIRYYMLSDGNYFAYHEKEKEKQIFQDNFVYAQQEKKIFKLPAVYDITWSGTRQIRAPFFSAIGSMCTVAFQSSYVLNDLVGHYYQPGKLNNLYLVLIVDVEFSTDGDSNMMTMMCTDIEGEYEPKTDAMTGRITPVKPPAVITPKERTKVWRKVALEAVYAFNGSFGTCPSTWQGLVDLLMASARFPYIKRWPHPPTVEDAISALVGWNPQLFESAYRMNYFSNAESKLFGRTMPSIYGRENNPITPGVGDKINLQLPFLHDYPESEEIVSHVVP